MWCLQRSATCLLVVSFATRAVSQHASSKRGIAYLGTSHPSDYNIFLTRQSPITWYYNWSPYPVGQPQAFSDIEFLPLIHNLDSLDSDIKQLSSLPRSSTHLATFNEPDGSTAGGGTDIGPEDAAQAYHEKIAPLSVANGGRWLISHPSTTGTLNGLSWLQRFNASCFAINETSGCHTDFIATHFYGNFPAMASWLGTLNEWYNTNQTREEGDLQMWITELALPQQSAAATETMMNTTLPYLDGLEYVARYSWFGIFRQENANEWTGDGVALLDNSGDLTELGATYLGPPFRAGLSASEGNAEGIAGRLDVQIGLALFLGVLSILLGRGV